ncbi:hypothetical protein CEP52_011702 [Fusarium oligoseptatum]|uniref:Uncharacterized protein n=1 Tax=Fusarium oligoseptatum TaxID=2604345 RepID=A0A428T1Z9_9HYPO|nr:hypothetical protein CEP52_011702 [Fusarium oligoseptatum]
MDSPDSTSPKDDWPKKPIEIAPKDLADLIEEIWGLKTTKPKSPSKSSTSSPKKVINHFYPSQATEHDVKVKGSTEGNQPPKQAKKGKAENNPTPLAKDIAALEEIDDDESDSSVHTEDLAEPDQEEDNGKAAAAESKLAGWKSRKVKQSGLARNSKNVEHGPIATDTDASMGVGYVVVNCYHLWACVHVYKSCLIISFWKGQVDVIDRAIIDNHSEIGYTWQTLKQLYLEDEVAAHENQTHEADSVGLLFGGRI